MQDTLTEAPAPPAGESLAQDALGGKYLTFNLGKEEYGLSILKVREIIGVLDITQVPQSADFVQGVINLRGKVIPVVDLRGKFGLPRIAYNQETCIIVVDVGEAMGIIVDTVREVYDIESDQIDPPPDIGDGHAHEFVLGMGKVDGAVKILLDIDQVLTSEALVSGADYEG